MGLFQGNNKPATRYNGLRTAEAILGTPLVILIGQQRVSWKLLWYGAFNSQVAKQQSSGGSGAGKGATSFVYSASVAGAVCMGPCQNFLGVWDSTGRYAMDTNNEQTVLPGSGSIQYTPANQLNFKQDLGVSLVTAYSVVADDYGSPGPVTLTGNYNTPLQYTASPTPPPGYYSIIGGGTPIYVFNPAQAGATVVVNYVSFRYFIQEDELDVAAATVTVQYQSQYNYDVGVKYYPSGVAFTKVTGTPTVAGTYNPNNGHYLFAPADFGLGVTVSYVYKDANTDTNAPSTLNLTFFGGGRSQSPWSYLTSSFPANALGYTEVAYVASIGLYLGYTQILPQLNFEILGPYSFGAGIPDANPADAIYGLLTNPQYKYNFPATRIHKSLLGSYTITGSVTSGTFIPNEVLLQTSTGAEANYISGSPMTVGILYGAAPPDASHTWVGQSSGAIFTPSAVPAFKGASSARAMWTANNFFISDILDSQTSLMDTIGRWCEAGQVYVSWDEGMVKFIPLVDTTTVANGITYTPPTQPVIDLDDNDFVPSSKGKAPVSFTQKPWQSRWNKVNVRWSVRSNDYNEDILSAQDEASIQEYDPIIESPQDYQFICSENAAQFAANMRLQRYSAIYTTYTTTLKSNFAFLSPGDIVTITDGQLGTPGTLFGRTPIRITKMVDDPRKGIMIEAENFPWSVGAALLVNKQAQLPSNTNDGPQADPGDTVPIIFEIPAEAANFHGGNIYIFTNGSQVNWGGCEVYVSFNGTDYSYFGTTKIPARTGITTADYPVHTDPDNVDTLTVNMQQSGAVLQSVTLADRDAFVTLSALVTPGSPFNQANIATAGATLGASGSTGSSGTQGPNDVQSGTQQVIGGATPWTNPAGVIGSTAPATCAMVFSSALTQSNYLHAWNPGFTVPSFGVGPVIGLQVTFDAWISSYVGAAGATAGIEGTLSNSGAGLVSLVPSLTLVRTTYVVGSLSNLNFWGNPHLSAFDVNDVIFGLTALAICGGTQLGQHITVSVENVKIEVAWAAGGPAPPWANPGNVGSLVNFATTTLTPDEGQTQYLFAYDFGFSMPFGFVLSGVIVTINVASSLDFVQVYAQLTANGLRVGVPYQRQVAPGAASDIQFGTGSGSFMEFNWDITDLNAQGQTGFGVMLSCKDFGSTTISIRDVRITLIGSSTTNLELIAYENATLVGLNTYALTSIRRGILGSAPCDHPATAVFARMDQASIVYEVPSNFAGQAIFFKFLSFNAYGNQLQSLAAVLPFEVEILYLSPGAIDPKTGNLQTGTPNFSTDHIDTALTILNGSYGFQNIPNGYVQAGVGPAGVPQWQPMITGGGGGDNSQIMNFFGRRVSASTAANPWDYIEVDTTGGPVTITLPSALGNPDTCVGVKKISTDSNAITIATSGGDTVEISTFSVKNTAYYFGSDGLVANWFVAWAYTFLPPALIGDILRFNTTGDGNWDAVNQAAQFVNIYCITGGSLTGTGPGINSGLIVFGTGGASTIASTATQPSGERIFSSSTASPNMIIFVKSAENGSNTMLPLLAWYRFSMKIGFENTSGRYWLGLYTWVTGSGFGNNGVVIGSGQTTYATDTPNKNTIGFRYSAGVDAHWQAVVCSGGGSQTTVDTGVNIDTGVHLFEMAMNALGTSITFYIDGVLVATISSSIPSHDLVAGVFFAGDNKNITGVVAADFYWVQWSLK